MAPGGYLISAAAVSAGTGLISYFYTWLVSIPFGLLVLALLFQCVLGCGYRPSDNNGDGSICPKCNERHFIWPWSL